MYALIDDGSPVLFASSCAVVQPQHASYTLLYVTQLSSGVFAAVGERYYKVCGAVWHLSSDQCCITVYPAAPGVQLPCCRHALVLVILCCVLPHAALPS
jgi:hypothetical protein